VLSDKWAYRSLSRKDKEMTHSENMEEAYSAGKSDVATGYDNADLPCRCKICLSAYDRGYYEGLAEYAARCQVRQLEED
jgi:hypothetical protein